MSLHLILGPMFSKKSKRLLEYIRESKIVEYDVMSIKPSNDIRYTDKHVICTHDKETEPCHMVPINQLESIYELEEFKKAKIIFIEEGQFFKGLYEAVMYMMDKCNKKIYISALNGDSQRKPFGEINQLLSLAHHIEWMTALCIKCKDGTKGIYSKAKIVLADQIHVGSAEEYDAVCLKHYLEE